MNWVVDLLQKIAISRKGTLKELIEGFAFVIETFFGEAHFR